MLYFYPIRVRTATPCINRAFDFGLSTYFIRAFHAIGGDAVSIRRIVVVDRAGRVHVADVVSVPDVG